jgi:hypothetical protein
MQPTRRTPNLKTGRLRCLGVPFGVDCPQNEDRSLDRRSCLFLLAGAGGCGAHDCDLYSSRSPAVVLEEECGTEEGRIRRVVRRGCRPFSDRQFRAGTKVRPNRRRKEWRRNSGEDLLFLERSHDVRMRGGEGGGLLRSIMGPSGRSSMY